MHLKSWRIDMNRNQAKELLPIIKAFSEGKAIQQTDGYDWYDLDDPDFMANGSSYRIKPETKYRPFKNADECWQEMQKYKPFGWLKDKNDGHLTLITVVDNDNMMALNGRVGLDLLSMMNNYVFADGTPFGVKVEE